MALDDLVRANLKHLRIAESMTLSDVGRGAGWTVDGEKISDAAAAKRVYRVANGESTPDLDWLAGVARALGVEPWMLLFDG